MNNQVLYFILCLTLNFCIQAIDPNEALLQASRSGQHEHIVSLIKVEGANINTLDKNKRTPIMLAALYDNISTVEQLLMYTSKLDEQDNDGDTALMLAVSSSPEERITENTYKILEILLEHGASPFLKNKQGKTALDLVQQKKIKDQLASQAIELLERYMQKFSK